MPGPEPAPSAEPPPPPAQGHLTLLEAVLALALLGGVVILVVLPAMREARIRKNESSAISSLNAIAAAEKEYHYMLFASKVGSSGVRAEVRYLYGTLSQLAQQNPSVIDSALAGGRKDGYSFVLELREGEYGPGFYRVRANPIRPESSGRRFFCVDLSPWVVPAGSGTAVVNFHRIRSRLGAPASSTDSPIE